MVELRKMTAAEYEVFRAASKEEFLKEKIKSEDRPREELEPEVDKHLASILPSGQNTPDHYFYSVVYGATRIGSLWFAVRGKKNPKAFLYDISLEPEHQDKGFGRLTMLLLEDEARKLGLKRVGLHVFGHNQRARALYGKLGYEVIDLVLEKSLD
jgi:ribosomal protein S18 acetylase RimI-like enzyme